MQPTLSLSVRRLQPSDAPAYRELRLRALTQDPQAYMTSAEEYLTRPLPEIAADLSAQDDRFTLGAHLGARLVGIATLVRSTRQKQRHRADVMGVYVAPDVRGQGAGSALLTDLIRRARAMPGLAALGISVTETQTAARRLYERFGFEVWGTEPDALRLDGRALTELHLQRRL